VRAAARTALASPSLAEAPDEVSSSLGRWVLYFSVAAVGCAVDLATKGWIFDRVGMPGTERHIPIFGDVLRLETSLNEGALFGFGQGGQPVFIAMSVFAAISIVGWLWYGRGIEDRRLTLALGCVTGGIFGNLYDRLGLPGLKWNYPSDRVGEPVAAVRDWIHFQIPAISFDFPLFNVADSLLFCGVCFLLWQTFRAETHREQTAES
jgi:signal peptidase II